MFEFAYNNTESSATHMTPMFMITGQHPHVPMTMAADELRLLSGIPEKAYSQDAMEIAVQRHVLFHAAKASIVKAQGLARMKKYADLERQEAPIFKAGDKVLLRSKCMQLPQTKLSRRWLGPLNFKVIGKIGDLAYKIKLPKPLKKHNVINVGFLKLFKGEEPKTATLMQDYMGLTVEAIMSHRIKGKKESPVIVFKITCNYP